MTKSLAGVTAAVLGLLVPGCVSGPLERPAGERERLRDGSAIVVDGSDIQGRSETLLGLLEDRVPGMSVSYGGPCPEIRLRGTRSLFGSNTPSIYVDGARALDTCVLDELATSIVERIEVYPSGVAHRPGYDSDRNGLILVFVLYGTEY